MKRNQKRKAAAPSQANALPPHKHRQACATTAKFTSVLDDLPFADAQAAVSHLLADIYIAHQKYPPMLVWDGGRGLEAHQIDQCGVLHRDYRPIAWGAGDFLFEVSVITSPPRVLLHLGPSRLRISFTPDEVSHFVSKHLRTFNSVGTSPLHLDDGCILSFGWKDHRSASLIATSNDSALVSEVLLLPDDVGALAEDLKGAAKFLRCIFVEGEFGEESRPSHVLSPNLH